MEQAKALNALEPFLALTKSANSPKAAADLITHATSAQGTYIFTELLANPSIQALASSPEYQPYLTQLQIFSNGLYSTYTSTPGLPDLTDRQRLKLRQLSLLTLSRNNGGDDSSEPNNLTYPTLQRHLGLSSPREVEDLVVSAVYAGLLSAKLNPLRSVVQVSSVAPLRDVQPDTVPGIVDTLRAWSRRCDATLAEIEANIAGIKKDAARKANGKREWDRTFQAVVKAETADPVDPSGGGGGSISANGARGPGRRLGGGAAGRTGGRITSGGHTAAGGSGAGAGGASHAAAGNASSGSKRAMENLAEDLEDDDDEAMDLDDSADATSQTQKRTSRRKL